VTAALKQPEGQLDYTRIGGFAPYFASYLHHNTIIMRWMRGLNVEAVRELRASNDRAHEQSGFAQLSSIHLVFPEIALPDIAARAQLPALAKESAARTACTALIVHGGGFKFNAARAIITGLRAVLPGQVFDLRANTTIDELLTWFPAEHQRRTGVALDVASLRRVLEHIESAPAT
jgi:hypothetical protein